MKENEKEIVKAIDKNIKYFSESQKQYFLGYIEGVANAQKPKRKKKNAE